MSIKKNLSGSYYILRNLIFTPSIRLLLFFCICIQTFIAFWGFYNIWNVNTWGNVYDTTENISNYVTKVIECLVSFALLKSVLVKTRTFLGEPERLRFSLFNDIGFRSVWMGMGTFYLICCSVTDDQAMKLLTEQVQFMATDTESLKDQVKFVYWARYITFTAGVLCIVFSVLLKFGQKLPCCGHIFDNGNVDGDEDVDSAHPPKKWTQVSTRVNKILLFVYYFFIISFPLFVISIQIVYLHLEFRNYQAATTTTTSQVVSIFEEVVGAKLLYGLPDLLLACIVLQRFVKQFWYRPYKPTQSITILLYVYQLFSVHSQAKKYSSLIVLDGISVSDELFRQTTLVLLIIYIAFPVLFWIVFITCGKHVAADLTTASGSSTNGSLTLIKSVFGRIWSPVANIFRKYILKPVKWYTTIYTLAVLFGIAGGVATTLSQTYQKFYIDFEGLDVLNDINNEFLAINNKIVDVSNGFVVVAANLNPCMDYSKTSSGGSSLNTLISSQVTAKGDDGHSGSNPVSGKTMIQQLYDESSDSNFRKDCFKTVNGKLTYSGNTANKDCLNVKNLADNDFGIKTLQDKEAGNTATPPSCPNEEACLANSQSVIKDEYELSINEECEKATCGIFISGIVAAFAASFVPFGGPAIGKGLQIALRITKGVKQFGKVFKRVATQVKSKLSKIKNLYTTFSKILGDSNLSVVNNYQFFYFLAPAILLGIIAFGLGFFRRRKSNSSSKTVFVSFFALLSGACGTFTYLSFIFTDILTEMFKPFSAFAKVSVKTAVGMDMIKWGYALSTVSSLLFLLAALYSTIASYVFGEAYDKPTDDQLNEHERQELQKDERKRQRRVRQAAAHHQNHKKQRKSEVHYVNKFSGWLVAFLVTLPVYYFIHTANTSQASLVTIQLTPSVGLEEVRVTFGHTNALEREFGSADDLNDETNQNLCDIVASAVKAIIDKMKLPIPGGSIKGLFDINISIRKNVADVIKRVRDAVSLNVNGFNLFEGGIFPKIPLAFESWQIVLVFGMSAFVCVGTAICMLLTFVQQIGFFRKNKALNDIILPCFDKIIIPASIGSFFNQLALIGLFSFMDGFQTPMFNLSMQVGEMVTYGLLASVVCLIATVFRLITEYAPIADDSTDDLIEEGKDEEAGLTTTVNM